MSTTNETTPQAQAETGNSPDWVAKTPRGYGRNQRLERVGAAWNREDGGLCLRLVGTQVVSDDIYLYPNTGLEADKGDAQ